ncbi:hypothetical protein VTO73DRAFT_5637 [Trametes versicolor]
MDGNNQSNNGVFSHILDPHLGQVIHELVRSFLPQHGHNAEAGEAASSSSTQTIEATDMPHLESAAPIQQQAVETELVSGPGGSEAHMPQSSSTSQSMADYVAAAAAPSTPYHAPQEAPPLGASVGDIHDVEMSSPVEDHPAGSSGEAFTSRPQLSSGNSRRARVDEEEDEDDARESNRQRMHAPTSHDDATHHFMPIPEAHAVPQAAPAANPAPQPGADTRHNPPADNISPLQRTIWRFDFLHAPAPGAHHDHANHAHEQPAEGAHHGVDLPQFTNAREALNFVFNLTAGQPRPADGAPTDPAAANPTDGGNVPGNGFVFPPFPFPFGPIGVDMLEERDDPERAQRLVDGVEEVPIGLVKRMERVGGPGSAQGEAPTCAVCWESLLDPEGGGFEGNAELARAEADQAAREDAASQQGERETSINLDTPTSASQGASSSSTSEASASTTPSTAPGEEKYPKIVVLPCSHVFHASCLLPWFSKPGRTTCPSCRFDIDPDSLTYKPRPLRARHAPPAPPAGADAAPQEPPAFAPPPQFVPVQLGPHPAPVPHAEAQGAPHIPNVAPGADAGVQTQGGGPEGQPGQQHAPLPPFITFDISMIIPIFPGRPAGAAAAPAPDGQATNNAAEANPQDAAPRPRPRTDRNGFRLDDPVLAAAVRNTFERVFGRPPPAEPQPQPQQAPAGGAAPANNADAPPRDPPLDWFTFAGPLPGFPPMPPPAYEDVAGAQRPAPKRKWTLPSAPGPTLRQLVERNERAMGLRCSDVSCGLGPSDEDPITTFDTAALRRVSIRPPKDDGSGKQAVCEHSFHPSCLVSAERVAGWGGEDKKEERENDEGEDVEVSCPVCRAVGVISRTDWDEGACALA